MTAAEYRALPMAKARALQRPGEYRNALEADYANHLEMRLRAGEIAKWRYERITFKLAHDVHLKLDWYVLKPDGLIEFHDTKGSFRRKLKSGERGEPQPLVDPNFRSKIHIAAQEWPEFRFLLVFRRGTKASPIWSAVEVTT